LIHWIRKTRSNQFNILFRTAALLIGLCAITLRAATADDARSPGVDAETHPGAEAGAKLERSGSGPVGTVAATLKEAGVSDIPPRQSAPVVPADRPGSAGRPRLTFGADLYLGASNVSGVPARSNDGVWAGSGTAYPSVVSLNWQKDDLHTLHVSVGLGDMYTRCTIRDRQRAAGPSPSGSSTSRLPRRSGSTSRRLA
jgi:hypothetical protein